MRMYQVVLATILLFASVCTCFAESGGSFAEVGIDGDWLTVGGEKFLVVGLGYEIGCRPGMVPWDHEFRPDLLRADFKRIKEAGFNTLRTWNPMTDEELAVAAEFGLWVIQGIWYDAKADFGDQAFQEQALVQVAEAVTRSAKHPNILFYLVGNEPHGDAVYASGVGEVNAFYRKLVQTARRSDPKRHFSYANCVFTDFMVPDMWDLTAQNVYPYAPFTIEKTLGYRTYLEDVKHRLAKGKPLVITEFGLSVSKKGDGRGYGGNTLDEQRDGVVALWDDALNAGASGGCAFMWIDGWWKSGDADSHDNTSEEWYGLLAADDDPFGVPRPVYFALKEYNRAIRTMPRDGTRYAGKVPVEVLSPGAETVEARLDLGEWVALNDEHPWWRLDMDVSSLPKGMHVIHTRMREAGGEWGSEKQANIRITGADDIDRESLAVRFVSLPKRWRAGKVLPVTVVVRDDRGAPVVGKRVSVSRFVHTAWSEFETSAITDADGRVTVGVPTHHEPSIISIAAAVEGELSERNDTGWKQGPHKRYGVYRHVELVK